MDKGVNKPLVYLAVAAAIVLSLVAVVPITYKAIMNSGIQTGGISVESAKEPTVDFDGRWAVVSAASGNQTSVGYTFHEILPGEVRDTSGSTRGVSGEATIEGSTVQPGAKVVADLSQLETDQQRRDVSVRLKLLETDSFPEATFELTKPVDLKEVPSNGTVGHIVLTGLLTIKGTTNEVSTKFDILRTDSHIVLAGTVPINRLAYNVKTPEFIAAKVDDEGELNIRLVLE